MKPMHDHMATSAVSADLQVRVDRIGEEGLALDEVLSCDWINQALGESSPYRAQADGRLQAQLNEVERVVQVHGRVTVRLGGACVRCLGSAEVALDVPIELAMFPREKEPLADDEGEIAEEDVGTSVYDEGIVDLASVVHDEVFLELPMNLLCAESCAGLCPNCGTNLNEKRCNCSPEVDIRWQGLLSLKVD